MLRAADPVYDIEVTILEVRTEVPYTCPLYCSFECESLSPHSSSLSQSSSQSSSLSSSLSQSLFDSPSLSQSLSQSSSLSSQSLSHSPSFTHPLKEKGKFNQTFHQCIPEGQLSRGISVTICVKLWCKQEEEGRGKDHLYLGSSREAMSLESKTPIVINGGPEWYTIFSDDKASIGDVRLQVKGTRREFQGISGHAKARDSVRLTLRDSTDFMISEASLFLTQLAKKFRFDEAMVKPFYEVALNIGKSSLSDQEKSQAAEIIEMANAYKLPGDKKEDRELDMKGDRFERLMSRLQNIESSVTNFQTDQMGPKTAKYLLQKAIQIEASGKLSLAKAYYQVALNEANPTDETSQQARQALANSQKLKEVAKKQQVEERAKKLAEEMEETRKRLQNVQSAAEKEEVMRREQALARERENLEERRAKVEEGERKQAEFMERYKAWEKKLEIPEAKGTKESSQMLVSVRDANSEVERDRFEYIDKTAKAEDARVRLTKSEEELREKIERLNSYIVIVEQQGMQPEAAHFRELLKATKHLSSSLSRTKVKCFVSYAWQPEKRENATLQAKIVKIKSDLEKAGIEVMLDIHNMEGDIDRYMMDGIQGSDRVLLICTPRFRERAEEKKEVQNNLQKEFNAALQRQSQDPKFIIPLILEGDRTNAIAQDLPNILSLDFTEPKKYCDNMISLSPKGLIPMILGLEKHKVYVQLLKGYQAHLKLLSLSVL